MENRLNATSREDESKNLKIVFQTFCKNSSEDSKNNISAMRCVKRKQHLAKLICVDFIKFLIFFRNFAFLLVDFHVG